MRILFAGDIVGKSGREVLKKYLKPMRENWKLDCIIVNGENAAHGFGLTPKMYDEFLRDGADVVTLGNHTFDKKEILPALETEEFLVRPLNYPENTVGHGFCIKKLPNGQKIAVVQLLGQLFMREVLNPFEVVKTWLNNYKFGRDYDALIIDMHAEATSEKLAMGRFLDGKAAAVIGTHTHVPTADAMILPGGTASIADVGMCGNYESILGMQISGALSRFLPSVPSERLAPADGAGTFSGLFVETDDKTGLAKKIKPIIIGPHLTNTIQLDSPL